MIIDLGTTVFAFCLIPAASGITVFGLWVVWRAY